MATTPSTHPDLYTSILLGGVWSPGKVTLSGYDRAHDWEVQRAKGTTGTTPVNHGPKNGGFTASFYMADLEDVAAWDEFQRLISSTVEGPKPKAMIVYHPDLVRNKILDVVCESISGFVHDGKGGATVTVKFLEYRPAKPKASVKPNASARVGTTTLDTAASRPDPNAEAKRELAALLEQAKAP